MEWNNLFGLILYVPVITFSTMSGRIFLDCLFDLILYVPSTIFQLNRDGSSWVEISTKPGLMFLAQGHNAVTPVRLEPAALRPRVKHSTTEPVAPYGLE